MDKLTKNESATKVVDFVDGLSSSLSDANKRTILSVAYRSVHARITPKPKKEEITMQQKPKVVKKPKSKK